MPVYGGNLVSSKPFSSDDMWANSCSTYNLRTQMIKHSKADVIVQLCFTTEVQQGNGTIDMF